MTAQNIILGITATLTALIAGLFYAYSCSVNIGLAKLPDSQYIAAMQSINREIQNPAFFLSFIGTLLMLPISTFFQYKDGTMNSLQSATIQQITEARTRFETSWNRLHTIRTIASIMVLLLVIIACIYKPAKQII